jgi:hypothetical protein
METAFQFFIHDICWNACYYTWRAIFYVLMLLPFAALGLIGVYARKLKNKCCKRKEKVDKSPFSHFPKPAPSPHYDTPVLSNEDEKEEDVKTSKIITQSERRRREVTVLRGIDNMSPPRFETKGDFIIVVDLDHTLVYSQQVIGGDSRSKTMNESCLTIQVRNNKVIDIRALEA